MGIEEAVCCIVDAASEADAMMAIRKAEYATIESNTMATPTWMMGNDLVAR